MISNDNILSEVRLSIKNIGVLLCRDDSRLNKFIVSRENLIIKLVGFFKVNKKKTERLASLLDGELGRLGARLTIFNVEEKDILIMRFYYNNTNIIMGASKENEVKILPDFTINAVLPSALPNKAVRIIIFLSGLLNKPRIFRIISKQSIEYS